MKVDDHITFDKYLKMIESGAFDQDPRRIELVSGRLHDIGIPSPRHADMASHLTQFLYSGGLREKFVLWIKNPIAIPDLDSCPEPDLALVKNASYWKR